MTISDIVRANKRAEPIGVFKRFDATFLETPKIYFTLYNETVQYYFRQTFSGTVTEGYLKGINKISIDVNKLYKEIYGDIPTAAPTDVYKLKYLKYKTKYLKYKHQI